MGLGFRGLGFHLKRELVGFRVSYKAFIYDILKIYWLILSSLTATKVLLRVRADEISFGATIRACERGRMGPGAWVGDL